MSFPSDAVKASNLKFLFGFAVRNKVETCTIFVRFVRICRDGVHAILLGQTAQLNEEGEIVLESVTQNSGMKALKPTIRVSPISTAMKAARRVRPFVFNETYRLTIPFKRLHVFLRVEYVNTRKNGIDRLKTESRGGKTLHDVMVLEAGHYQSLPPPFEKIDTHLYKMAVHTVGSGVGRMPSANGGLTSDQKGWMRAHNYLISDVFDETLSLKDALKKYLPLPEYSAFVKSVIEGRGSAERIALDTKHRFEILFGSHSLQGVNKELYTLINSARNFFEHKTPLKTRITIQVKATDILNRTHGGMCAEGSPLFIIGPCDDTQQLWRGSFAEAPPGPAYVMDAGERTSQVVFIEVKLGVRTVISGCDTIRMPFMHNTANLSPDIVVESFGAKPDGVRCAIPLNFSTLFVDRLKKVFVDGDAKWSDHELRCLLTLGDVIAFQMNEEVTEASKVLMARAHMLMLG